VRGVVLYRERFFVAVVLDERLYFEREVPEE
jgi:hypothetical protein